MNGTISYLYGYISDVLVEFENHRFESSRLDSIRMKSIVFEFFSDFLTLFLLTFISFEGEEENFDGIAVRISSIVVSNFFGDIFAVSIKPLIMYKCLQWWNSYNEKSETEKYQLVNFQNFNFSKSIQTSLTSKDSSRS